MSFDVSRLGVLNQPFSRDVGREVPLRSGEPSFVDVLKEYVGGVQELERTAEARVRDFANGESVDPHEVMLAVEQANLALDLLIEVRNKLLDAYNELSRTPV